MSHRQRAPHIHHVHRKSVPPGSQLYKQVLDDLRHDSGQSSSSSPSPSKPLSNSSLSWLQSDHYSVNARAELRQQDPDKVGHALDPYFQTGGSQGQGRDLSEGCFQERCGDSERRSLYSVCNQGGYCRCRHLSVRRQSGGDGGGNGLQSTGWIGRGAGVCDCGQGNEGACIQIREFVEDLQLDAVQHSHSVMGHSTSLLRHKPDGHHYLTSAHGHAPHPHHPHHPRPCTHSFPAKGHHSKQPGKETVAYNPHLADLKLSGHVDKRQTRSATAHATPGHVVSWSVSGCQDHSKVFSDPEKPEDTESPFDRAQPTLARLQPQGATPQRQSSPSPSRGRMGCEDWGGKGKERGRTGRRYSPSRPNNVKGGNELREGREPEGEELRKTSVEYHGDLQTERTDSGSVGTPSLLQVPGQLTTKNGATGGQGVMCSICTPPGSPSLQHLRLSPTQGRAERCSRIRGTPIYTGHSDPTQSPGSARQHVRLYAFRSELADADNVLSRLGEHFRPRSVSDVSMHLRRQRQLPHPSNMAEEHVHVHWADEERGSPLATSVILSSIRPRALSHGAVESPAKPILKNRSGH